MKLIKKIGSVITVLSLILSLSVVVIADEKQTKTYENPRVLTSSGTKYLSGYVSYDPDLENALVSAWSNYKSEINVFRFSIYEDNIDLYYYILDLYPEYFYVANYISYETNSLGRVLYININYSYSKSFCELQKNKLDEKVDSILSKMRGIDKDEDKVVFIHDYIATHNEYDENGVTGDVDLVDDYSFTAYGCLVDGVSVCQGMSDAFVLLCKKVGIKAYIISSNEMVHAWNCVEINGKNYHLDITWNDSASDIGLGFNGTDFLDVKGFASHKYFMKSDSQMLALDHTSWNKICTASDSRTYSDYYWKDVYSHIYYIKGNQYFIRDSKLIKRNPSTGEKKVLYTIENGKYSVSGTDYVWYSKNAVLSYNYSDKFLLMNLSDGVYAYNLYSGEVSKVLDYNKDGYIGGILFEEDTLYYDLISVKNNKLFRLDSTNEKISLPDYSAVYGDANCDGNVGLADILELRKHLANYQNDINEFAADVNEDNQINLQDLLLLYKYFLKYDVVLGG